MRRGKPLGSRVVTWRTQRGVLLDVMLSAAQCGAWLTLGELTMLTRYPQASISAQLRHLRKPRYGSFVVEKRRRECEEVGRIVQRGVVWEYRLNTSLRSTSREVSRRIKPRKRRRAAVGRR